MISDDDDYSEAKGIVNAPETQVSPAKAQASPATKAFKHEHELPQIESQDQLTWIEPALCNYMHICWQCFPGNVNCLTLSNCLQVSVLRSSETGF